MRVKSFKNSEGIDIFKMQDKTQFIEELVKNKSEIIKLKKSTPSEKSLPIIKLENPTPTPKLNTSLKDDEMIIRPVGNVANWMDEDDDVILTGAYNKSVVERGDYIQFLKDHTHNTDGIIGETLKSYVQEIPTSLFGVETDVPTTEAFMQDVLLSETLTGKGTLLKFRKNLIRAYSIGLRYIKIRLAVNDDNWKEEFEVWDKFYDKVINKEKADRLGYFWAVNEIAIMENSAVVFPANTLTYTMDIETNSAVEGDSEVLDNEDLSLQKAHIEFEMFNFYKSLTQ